jgi:anti-sigma regulatory factor (Ser/Thr protein kinase)
MLKMCDGLPTAIVDAAQLLVSELVTNAVDHGEGPIRLQISRHRGTLRVEVSDTGAQFAPLTTTPDPQAIGGRGLFLLEALATKWGTIPADRHGPKTLWFELK